ncbi:hypothetical protein C1645_821744 [Glomus cerebriforme]|uniref:NmrA-like domain-containing protein n=1 Tax=Glomus cerebriforme TaxID=658196 RepID=A0A397T9B5_9GLOM|nr:hypothetical protein C1645_821744 [Glomus cerebriforme]
MSSQFQTVTIAGGTGNLGFSIAQEFLNDGTFKLKILRRKPEKENEKAKLLASRGAEIIYADYNQKDDLVKALKGTDVFISTVSGYADADNVKLYENQFPLLVAAKEASVKRFIPSDFGIEFKAGINRIADDKLKFNEEVIKSGLEYTFITTGLFQEFFDWLGFDVKNKQVKFYDDPDARFPTTALSDVAKYTVESLKIPECRNAHIKVAGAYLTWNEYLQKFEEISGSKWEVTVDKEVRHRYRNKIDPVPSASDDFRASIMQDGLKYETDNDKFSFTPQPVTKVIETLVKQAS